MYDKPLYAYKGFVYKIELDGLIISERYMKFLNSGEKVDLSSWGEITLKQFKEIVDTHLNAELK